MAAMDELLARLGKGGDTEDASKVTRDGQNNLETKRSLSLEKLIRSFSFQPKSRKYRTRHTIGTTELRHSSILDWNAADARSLTAPTSRGYHP